VSVHVWLGVGWMWVYVEVHCACLACQLTRLINIRKCTSESWGWGGGIDFYACSFVDACMHRIANASAYQVNMRQCSAWIM